MFTFLTMITPLSELPDHTLCRCIWEWRIITYTVSRQLQLLVWSSLRLRSKDYQLKSGFLLLIRFKNATSDGGWLRYAGLKPINIGLVAPGINAGVYQGRCKILPELVLHKRVCSLTPGRDAGGCGARINSCTIVPLHPCTIVPLHLL